MYIDLSTLSANQVYYSMIQTIIPRPVAWVLSENENSSFNLAPFSYFTAVSSRPPIIMLSVGKKPDGSYKDTRMNIEARSHFVVHIAHEDMVVDVTESSRNLPLGDSELDRAGLKTQVFENFPLPRLADCRIALACECHSIQELGEVPQSLVFGQVKSIFVDDTVGHIDANGHLNVDAAAVQPIARLGGDEYATFGKVISVPRPK